MEKTDSLGPFEQLVLTATYLLRGEGYSVSITDKVSELSPKRVMLGSVYVSLDRLERRGLVTAWFADPAHKRGAQAKRCFKVTPAGERALKQTMATAKLIMDALGDFV